MRKHRPTFPVGNRSKISSALPLLCVCFLIGTLLAAALCKAIGSQQDLQTYIRQYCGALSSGASLVSASIGSVVVAYYRMPFAIFLSSFTRISRLLFSAIFLLEGFFFSFTATSFSLALGKQGVLLALSFLGLRFLFVIPSSVCLAIYKFSPPKTRSNPPHTSASVSMASRYIYLIPAFLALGVLAEITIVPKIAIFVLHTL